MGAYYEALSRGERLERVVYGFVSLYINAIPKKELLMLIDKGHDKC